MTTKRVEKSEDWQDSCACYTCECGYSLILDTQNGATPCECGRIYSLVTYVVEIVEE